MVSYAASFIFVISLRVWFLCISQAVEVTEQNDIGLGRRSTVHHSCAAFVDRLEDVFHLTSLVTENAVRLVMEDTAYSRQTLIPYFTDDNPTIRRVLRNFYYGVYKETAHYPGGRTSVMCESGGITVSPSNCAGLSTVTIPSTRTIVLVCFSTKIVYLQKAVSDKLLQCHGFFDLFLFDRELRRLDQVLAIIHALLYLAGSTSDQPARGEVIAVLDEARFRHSTMPDALKDIYTYGQYAKMVYFQLRL